MDLVIVQGDCVEVMKTLKANSVDTVITDQPYGLSFMGKEWDKFTDNEAFQEWTRLWCVEALRVLKPGGMMLCFGGTRTYHRIACGIEDAGFEIRDTMMWLYGSGFPKSYNIGKNLEGWDGWGTALKPAYEPIIVAMKPREGTYVNNAEKYGVAGLNIDGSRVKATDKIGKRSTGGFTGDKYNSDPKYEIKNQDYDNTGGRFPANILHDGSEEVVELFPNSGSGKLVKKKRSRNIFNDKDIGSNPMVDNYGDSGSAARFFYCAKASKKERNMGCEDMSDSIGGGLQGTEDQSMLTGSGNIRNNIMKNNHPTVKPVKLMEYLCTLTKTPTGGIVLDPFAGSGSTGIACKNMGRPFLGIELDEHYCEIARRRIDAI
ncbi:MAG: site-specific DNA-methyltransferase [Chloroflexi bacterium]|nr:MAG: site-specific DNA-methyltransferase [Chloroflexota bacterium]